MGTENYTGNLIGRRQSEYARIFFFVLVASFALKREE